MDLRRTDLPLGPYVVSFRLQRETACQGEIFYTVDAKKTLPKGNKTAFEVESSSSWQKFQVALPTSERIHQLRIDIGDGPGKAIISDLKLQTKQGQTLMQWPVPESHPAK